MSAVASRTLGKVPSKPSPQDGFPSITIMEVTPEIAKEWLGSNQKNRRPKKSTVQAYSRDMGAGAWKLAGDPIRFDTDGKLLDGQHRLLACIIAERPFQTVVMRDLNPEIMRVLDHGCKRTVADELTIEGKRWATLVAAAARWLYIFKNGSSAIGKGRVTETEILRMVDRHPLLEESCGVSYASYGMQASLLASVHYVGGQLLGEQEAADNFASVYVSGHSFYEEDAALAWRERLIRMKQTQTRLSQDFLQRGSIHAWNNFQERIPVRTARAPEVVSFHNLDYKLL